MLEEPIPSFNEQVRQLAKGKSVAVAERYALDAIPEDGLNDVVSRIRRTINAQVSRVRERNVGSNFRVESAVTLTYDGGAVIIVVVITRT